MKRITELIGLLVFTIVGQSSIAQTSQEIAFMKWTEAVKLLDEGKVYESIQLLKEAEDIDPDRFDYPYELAYAYYLSEDHKSVIKILRRIESHKDVTERLYQLLGNSYDILGHSDKALAAYERGLKKFPSSGLIYCEMGNVYWGIDLMLALHFYEKGIEIDPEYPSNYYEAALLYCNSNESVWGLIYGEIYMNLERNSARSQEVSKLLFDTYKSNITFTSDSSAMVSFCQQVTILVESESNTQSVYLPFCMIYEPTLIMSLDYERSIDINSLSVLRSRFVDNYYDRNYDQKYPNVLFEYQKKVRDAGHIESYSHWILMKGDEEVFVKWKTLNEDKWESFVEWFNENGLKLDHENKFFREQY